MMNGFLKRSDNGVIIVGIDYGGVGTVLAENDRYIAIKWPAHKFWSGRGEWKYASPTIVVYSRPYKPAGIEVDREYISEIIEWDVTRSKKGVAK